MPLARRHPISAPVPRRQGAAGRASVRQRAFGALAVAGLLALTACSGGGDDSASETAFDEADQGESASQALNGGGANNATVDQAVSGPAQEQLTASTVPAQPNSDAKAADQSGTPAVAALQPIDIGRSIIFTATLTLEVDNVVAASDQAMTAVAGVGGFLYGQQGSSSGTPTNVLTFKVAPKDFQETLRRLGGLGRLAEQQVTSDDVTERLIDLQSRIRAAEISVERLRAFVAQASDVTSLAALERELLQRETDLETLRGQERGLEVQVDLATITLTLTQLAPDGPAVEITVTSYPGTDAAGTTTCPGDDLLRITEDDPMTVCYEIRNTGSLSLTQLRLDDPGLELARDEIQVVDGDLDQPLDPDQSIVLAATVKADRQRAAAPRLRAVAVDGAGAAVRTQVTTTVTGPEVNVEVDTTVPGFATSFSRGLRALWAVLQVLIMLAGVLLPFAWVPVGAYFLIRLLRARKARRVPLRPAGPSAGPPASTGPPPFNPGPGAAGPGAPPTQAPSEPADGGVPGSSPVGDPQAVGTTARR